jgi:nucleotide-binding universal stress UspA family protein
MNVLVALDGSRLSESSLAYLPLLKPMAIETVTLVAVVEDMDDAPEGRGSDEFFERQSVLYGAYLRDTAKKLRQAMSCDVRIEVACGVPDQEIHKLAERTGADLVAITTHGRSGITRWAIGSTADKVIRDAGQPTFVIGPEAFKRCPPPAIKKVLAPVDGSPLAEAGLIAASAWARGLSAELHAVRVVQVPPASADESLVAYSPDLIESMQNAAADYLSSLATRTGVEPSHSAVLTGSTAAELIRYCEEQGIDLVVMASRGRRGMVRTVLGSTTDRMLHAPAPALIIPSR